MNFDNRTDPYWYSNSLYCFHNKRPIKGGMANYDKNGKLVSQKLKDGNLQNYELTIKNFEDDIINNEEYDEEEKKKILNTEYDELISLKEAYHNNPDEQDKIDKLIEYLDNQFTEDEKKERDKKTELIIKKTNKFIDGTKETPLYKLAEEKAEDEIKDELFKKLISFFHKIDFKTTDNNLTADTLRNKMGHIEYSDFKDFLKSKGMKENEMSAYIGAILKELKDSNGEYYDGFKPWFMDILRGEKSEDIHDTHNILLSNYTGDFTEKYNSKDDNFYTPKFLNGLKNELKKFINKNDNTIDDEEINKTYNKVLESIKHFYPVDMRDKNNLYELKSRGKDTYKQGEKSKYYKTKFLDDDIFENIPYRIESKINDKILRTTYLFTPEKNNGKVAKIGMRIIFQYDGKMVEKNFNNIIPSGDYSIIWNDNNINGNIFLNASNKTPTLGADKTNYKFNYYNGDIVPPIQNMGYNYDKKNWTDRNYTFKKK